MVCVKHRAYVTDIAPVSRTRMCDNDQRELNYVMAARSVGRNSGQSVI